MPSGMHQLEFGGLDAAHGGIVVNFDLEFAEVLLIERGEEPRRQIRL